MISIIKNGIKIPSYFSAIIVGMIWIPIFFEIQEYLAKYYLGLNVYIVLLMIAHSVIMFIATVEFGVKQNRDLEDRTFLSYFRSFPRLNYGTKKTRMESVKRFIVLFIVGFSSIVVLKLTWLVN